MSQTGFITYGRAGQFAYNKPHRVERLKAIGGSGSTFEIYIGAIVAHDVAITSPTTVITAKDLSVKPFFQALGPEFKKTTGVTFPQTGNDLGVLAKLDTQTSVKVLSQGETIAYIDGVILPNMPWKVSDGAGGNVLGHVMAAAKGDGTKIGGRFLGLQGRDGKYIAAPSPNAVGTLGWISIDP